MGIATIILPGMGADHRLYPQAAYGHLDHVRFVSWPSYQNETTLQAVAQRLIDEQCITDQMIVGGASLGGMVAIEIAKRIGIGKVILIGSASGPQYLNPALTRLGSLGGRAPVERFQAVARLWNRYRNNELLAMFEETDPHFIRAMCAAMVRWEGLGGYGCKVCQIHGGQDRVILPPSENGATLVAGAGHLLPTTHGSMVAAFIQRHSQSR